MRTIYVSKRLLLVVAVVAGSAALLVGAASANKGAQSAPAAATQASVSINPVDANALAIEANQRRVAEVQQWLDAQTAAATTAATPQTQQARTPQAPRGHASGEDAPPDPDDYIYADEYADDAKGWFSAHGYDNPYDSAYQYWIDNEDGWYSSDE